MFGVLVPGKVVRDKIQEFEARILSQSGATLGNRVDFPLKHSFAGGLYIREILLPKGSLLTGRIHRHEHPIFILSGDVSIVEEGTGAVRIRAPYSGVSPAGTKRALYVHEDTVIVTVHQVGEERDIDKLEDMLTCWTYEEYRRGSLICHS